GRHFYATRGILNGVDIATMAALVGHRDITMTMRYTHLLTKSAHLDNAAEKAIGSNGVHAHPVPRTVGDYALGHNPPAPAAPAVPIVQVAAPIAQMPPDIIRLQTTLEIMLKRLTEDPPRKKRKPAARPKKLTPTQAAAYQQYLEVVAQCPELTLDRQVYDWLLSQGRKMVAFVTFVRYLSHARLFHNTRKHVLNLESELPGRKGGAA
ncbi:MAG TPA: hypothetical protein VG099_27410, partial [Gemmataceae bacterium]|nr:hypothetical protein [Gemmataceae bacterium]